MTAHLQDLVEYTRSLQLLGKAKRWDLGLALLQHLQDDALQAGGSPAASLASLFWDHHGYKSMVTNGQP